MSNTDIVLVVLADLEGATKAVDSEDVAEAAWKAAPARFSWPKLQRYPDLDAVDVTLRAAKKNDGLVSGTKREGWMLTPRGLARVDQRERAVQDFLAGASQVGRTENRRERGGMDASATRRLIELRQSAALTKTRNGEADTVTVHDFLAFFKVNQYMPARKYDNNRQAVENLVRGDQELLSLTRQLHERFGATYRTQLQEN